MKPADRATQRLATLMSQPYKEKRSHDARGEVERFRALERGEFNYGNLTMKYAAGMTPLSWILAVSEAWYVLACSFCSVGRRCSGSN